MRQIVVVMGARQVLYVVSLTAHGAHAHIPLCPRWRGQRGKVGGAVQDAILHPIGRAPNRPDQKCTVRREGFWFSAGKIFLRTC